jgi:hypothetical protein
VFRALLLSITALALAAPALGGSGASSSSFFVSTCRFSHMAPDDPIVSPRKPGYSHDHTFVGNVSTNAFSTPSTLLHAGTTCAPEADTAAYWAPTLLVDGAPVAPAGASIYYRRLTRVQVRPFPRGLRMVAGNSRAWRPQSIQVTFWDCGLIKTNFYGPIARWSSSSALPLVGAESSSVPRCPPKTQLQLHVNFPDCWNGRTLDSPDHKSHMAYSVAGRCPASHPVAVPAISLVYRYPPPGPGTVILSSGGQHSGHADFINSWKQAALARDVESCLNGHRRCGLGAYAQTPVANPN